MRKKKKTSYVLFRSRALQSLTLPSVKTKFFSKDDVEKWVKKEYKRHYGKK